MGASLRNGEGGRAAMASSGGVVTAHREKWLEHRDSLGMTQLCHGSRKPIVPWRSRTTPIRDGAGRMGNWVIVDVWLFWRLLETLAWAHAPSFTKQSQRLLSISHAT